MKDFVQNGIKVTRMRYAYRRVHKRTRQQIQSQAFIRALTFIPLFSLRASYQTLIFPFSLKATLPNYSPLNQ
jgi:hypothetical protein